MPVTLLPLCAVKGVKSGVNHVVMTITQDIAAFAHTTAHLLGLGESLRIRWLLSTDMQVPRHDDVTVCPWNINGDIINY